MTRNENILNYSEFIEKAMKDAIKCALKRAEKAKIGNFCFFLTIDTKVKGVKIPNYVKKQYPNEMVLVLQYQFDKLKVGNSSFSVELMFDDKVENIRVPFDAISVFSDHVADTELRFNTSDGSSEFYGGYFLEDEIECEFGDEADEEECCEFSDNLIMFKDIRRK